MKFESEAEKKVVEYLVDAGQRVWNDNDGDWPELESALRLMSPLVYPDFDIGEFLGDN